MNNPSLHSLFYSQHCLTFNWIFSVFGFQMLGVDLPFSAKLKSLLAPGSFAVKGLTVIKSLLISPGLVLLNEAICFPSAPHLMRPRFRALRTKGMWCLLCRGLELCRGTSPNSSRSRALEPDQTLLSIEETGFGRDWFYDRL